MDLEYEDWVNVNYDELLEVHGEDAYDNKTSYFNTLQTPQEYVNHETIFEKQSDDKEDDKDVIKLPTLTKESIETSYEPDPDCQQENNSDQDPIFPVFFKKENQFVEMKMDSSRLSFQESKLSCIETVPFEHDEKLGGDDVVNCSSPSKMMKKKAVAWKESNQRLNFWKWGLHGIGVLCGVGMTAASICIMICGSSRKPKQQNLSIQIYTDNKRIKQVVQKANEAMSAVRGVPLVKAQITFGGHYESL